MTRMSLPYRISTEGRTAVTDREGQIRDMVEMVLFTRRGERVNRPEFGAGVPEMVFSENAPEIAAAAQHMVQSALQQWLTGIVDVHRIEAEARENTLAVLVVYALSGDSVERQVRVEGQL